MAHFRYPNPSLLNATGRYVQQQQPTDDGDAYNRHGEASTTVSSMLDEIVLNGDSQSTLSLSSSSSDTSSSSTILASRTTTAGNRTVQQTTSQPRTEHEPRRCWICFGEDGDSDGRWIKPCACSLVAHEHCLLDWIAENQKGSPTKKVNCPQCASRYYVSEKTSLVVLLFGLVDGLVHAAAPYVTLLGLGCSVLITSTTYGAFSVLTFFGAKDGERLIGRPASWTWRTWISLPLIPAALITSRSRWADGALPFASVVILRLTGRSPSHLPQLTWPLSPEAALGLLPWIRLLYNNLYSLIQRYLSRRLLASDRHQNNIPSLQQGTASQNQVERDTTQAEADDTEPGRQDNTRRRDMDVLHGGHHLGISVIGALLWPTISSIIGSCLNHIRWVRQYFPDPFHRNLLGGCMFVVAKDIANLLYKYERIRQFRSRRVKNYNEINHTKRKSRS
ncbi:hypothetical protein EC973_009254 [Apophysomyces ossiformis]|uniref:RING-CH-type domain-containing protein n=1 Tax=Apophysomyces ossiformis TaxID=679940 RepID=A0A8H7ENI7_9FUNG|nr:hypothetical protein EC973_009254 [Apophysomyces ossiformis]